MLLIRTSPNLTKCSIIMIDSCVALRFNLQSNSSLLQLQFYCVVEVWANIPTSNDKSSACLFFLCVLRAKCIWPVCRFIFSWPNFQVSHSNNSLLFFFLKLLVALDLRPRPHLISESRFYDVKDSNAQRCLQTTCHPWTYSHEVATVKCIITCIWFSQTLSKTFTPWKTLMLTFADKGTFTHSKEATAGF